MSFKHKNKKNDVSGFNSDSSSNSEKAAAENSLPDDFLTPDNIIDENPAEGFYPENDEAESDNQTETANSSLKAGNFENVAMHSSAQEDLSGTEKLNNTAVAEDEAKRQKSSGRQGRSDQVSTVVSGEKSKNYTSYAYNPEEIYAAYQAESKEETDSTESEKNKQNKDVKDKSSSDADAKTAGQSSSQRVKTIFLWIIGFIVVALAVWGAFDIVDRVRSSKNKLKSPQDTGNALLETVINDDYEGFEQLTKPMHLDDPKQLFEEMQAATGDANGSLVSNFILIRLENGEEYLAALYYDAETNTYNFRSIDKVPAELQKYFAR